MRKNFPLINCGYFSFHPPTLPLFELVPLWLLSLCSPPLTQLSSHHRIHISSYILFFPSMINGSPIYASQISLVLLLLLPLIVLLFTSIMSTWILLSNQHCLFCLFLLHLEKLHTSSLSLSHINTYTQHRLDPVYFMYFTLSFFSVLLFSF